ncbi:MAG TPA: Mur ligase family protein [Candidatus Magasanikbacteria bacterium]|nr:Mur ligase family protein [Candidatus Magasanikbacteria bacterium]
MANRFKKIKKHFEIIIKIKNLKSKNKTIYSSKAQPEQKKIHFIGICGVAMSALAIAFKKAGFTVTGSDVGFFPPVSTNLKKNNINFYPGWHPENIGKPDLVIVGNVAGSTNPEWLYVQKNKLNYKSYPEAIEKFWLKSNSIVCAGTYGKTTTSALLSFILTEANYDPSYMFGGITINDFASAHLGNGNYSVLEGDEYKSSRWDNKAKFFHYHPTHLLLTDIKWDHADVYPTEQSYFEAFTKLINSIPKNGLLVASEKILNLKLPNIKYIQYGQTENCDYQYFDIEQTKNYINFKISHNSKIYNLQSPMLGEYMAENITGAFALAHQIGIEPKKIIKAITKFKGIKRRLEKRYVGQVTIFDDIAHSPAKVKSVLKNLKKIYQDSPEFISKSFKTINKTENILKQTQHHNKTRIICIFEPNGGNRQPESIPGYDNNFIDADEIIIPRLTNIKQDPNKPQNITGQELANIIAKTHPKVKYIDDDNQLINYLTNHTAQNDLIVFCGSHGFRGMIDELIKHYENS